jgi:hypothetical protein
MRLKFVRPATIRLAPLTVSDRQSRKISAITSSLNRLRKWAIAGSRGDVGREARSPPSGWVATASPLQTGRCLCLKRQEPPRRKVRCRGVAQLVEYRSPKPVVAGSSPAAPANSFNDLGDVLSEQSQTRPRSEAVSGSETAGREPGYAARWIGRRMAKLAERSAAAPKAKIH